MFNEIVVCLDGSPLAEKILPFARGVSAALGARLTALRVVADADELSGEESYMREQARLSGAQIEFAFSRDPAQAIIEELEKNPSAVAAMTTHGRTAWGEALLGSVAMRVLCGSQRPVILYRPQTINGGAPKKISTLALALDGSEFSESMIPFAAAMAKALPARLVLIQALPIDPPESFFPGQKSDIQESSYLQRKAREIKKTWHVDVEWEVLHGEAARAICQFVNGMPETMLALTTHGRGVLERVILGSVAGACMRHAGVPLFIYWPH